MAATTTVRVHRRKTPSAARRSKTIAEAREHVGAVAAKIAGAIPRIPRRDTEEKAEPQATPPAQPKSRTSVAAPAEKESPTLKVLGPAGGGPTLAHHPAIDLLNPVRPATSQPVDTGDGAFQADPFIAARARRGVYALEAPSWHAFRSYVTDRSDFDELRHVGLASMMKSHRSLALAIAAVALGAVLSIAAVSAYLLLAPATADADSPYATAEVTEAVSTQQSQWKAGEIPSLYQADAAWASQPYGQTTLANAGDAPTALTMAYVAVTGQTDKTPVDFAQWAIDHDLTASGTDTVCSYLTEAAADFGLSLSPIDSDEHSLRRAIVSNIPVLVVTEPGTFSPVASVVVLDDIDRDSRIVLHDPASVTRSGKSWDFDDITNAAAAVYEVHAA